MKTALLNAIKTAIFIAIFVDNTHQVVPKAVFVLLYDARDLVEASNISD